MPGASCRRPGASHLRNPATSVVTWPLPLLTGVFAAIAYESVLGSAFFFFLTVFIYGQLYRVMSLNAPQPAAGPGPAALSAASDKRFHKVVDASPRTKVPSRPRAPPSRDAPQDGPAALA